MIDNLIERLEGLAPMGESLKEKIRSMAKIIFHPSGSFILKEGQVCNKACLVVKGLARSYYINEGKDITSRFMDEGFIITSWVSFYQQKPGNEYIEAMEDCYLVYLDYTEIQKLY